MIRTHEALAAGIHPRTLYAMRDAGIIEQYGRGLFRLADLPPLSDPDLVVVARRIPSAVICLVSALAVHGLTTQVPHTVQIALGRGARTPCLAHPPIEVFRFFPDALEIGIERRLIDGVPVQIFGAEKTLVDVFRFRNRLGLDLAIEALRAYARGKRRCYDRVFQLARVCRVESVMRPYLEAVS